MRLFNLKRLLWICLSVGRSDIANKAIANVTDVVNIYGIKANTTVIKPSDIYSFLFELIYTNSSNMCFVASDAKRNMVEIMMPISCGCAA